MRMSSVDHTRISRVAKRYRLQNVKLDGVDDPHQHDHSQYWRQNKRETSQHDATKRSLLRANTTRSMRIGHILIGELNSRQLRQ